jgi:hypothetical protein
MTRATRGEKSSDQEKLAGPRTGSVKPGCSGFQGAETSGKIASVGAPRTTGPQRHSICLAPGREPVTGHLPLRTG